ncbi:MAG: nucleotidyl transferase AbiEii/AbiGii toxin family protein [Opitutaceae bacterium]|nr:nucleotidyl transferase AbiEii/AbiGii toxin family protein [Opitutaceae bacterium]
MIHPDCFQLPWLRQQAEAMRVQQANLHLLERCIHALELVGRLSDAGLNFVFKGGTSLVLLLQPVRRLSLDVDIATPEPIERIKAMLDQVATNQPPFLRYEHQTKRDRDAPPTKHFKIFFRSVAGPQPESYVLLDVITTGHRYAVTAKRSIAAPFIRLESDAQVVLPTVDCILGDKLAAFAPRTIGVLYDPLDRNGQVPRIIAQRVPSLAELRLIALSEENAALYPILRPLAPEALYYWSMIEDAIALSRDATP